MKLVNAILFRHLEPSSSRPEAEGRSGEIFPASEDASGVAKISPLASLGRDDEGLVTGWLGTWGDRDSTTTPVAMVAETAPSGKMDFASTASFSGKGDPAETTVMTWEFPRANASAPRRSSSSPASTVDQSEPAYRASSATSTTSPEDKSDGRLSCRLSLGAALPKPRFTEGRWGFSGLLLVFFRLVGAMGQLAKRAKPPNRCNCRGRRSALVSI